MKKQTGIWIDRSKAIIVTLSNETETVTEIGANIENRIYHENEGDKGSFMGSRHINNEKKFEERTAHQIDAFLKEVLQKIQDADELYVLGPADIKLKLQHKIENNNLLASKLKAVEAADSMTNNQVVAKIKGFFAN